MPWPRRPDVPSSAGENPSFDWVTNRLDSILLEVSKFDSAYGNSRVTAFAMESETSIGRHIPVEPVGQTSLRPSTDSLSAVRVTAGSRGSPAGRPGSRGRTGPICHSSQVPIGRYGVPFASRPMTGPGNLHCHMLTAFPLVKWRKREEKKTREP
jgi:hypothetical protein